MLNAYMYSRVPKSERSVWITETDQKQVQLQNVPISDVGASKIWLKWFGFPTTSEIRTILFGFRTFGFINWDQTERSVWSQLSEIDQWHLRNQCIITILLLFTFLFPVPIVRISNIVRNRNSLATEPNLFCPK